MTYEISRFDRAYFDTDAAVLPCQTMAIGDEIYDILAGNTPGTVEYFADVAYTDSDTALPYVDMISIERSMEQIAGTLHVGFMASSFPVSGLVQGVKITVQAGIRYGGKTAYMKVFHGRTQKVTNPSDGESIRGYLDAYDAGKDLQDEEVGTGQNTGPDAINLPPAISGDIFVWFADRLSTLQTADVELYLRTDATSVPDDTLVAYQSVAEAFKALANAYHFRYLFMTGDNRLCVLDPDFLSAADPLFTLAQGGIARKQKIDSLIDRINRVPYAKAGSTADSSIYWVDEFGVMRQTAAEEVDAITGTYNDTTDQASYPILEGDTLRNDIVTTAAELETLAEEYADETQRDRYDLVIRFNPFIELGDVIKIGTDKYFIYRLRHDIAAGQAWQTKIELRAL